MAMPGPFPIFPVSLFSLLHTFYDSRMPVLSPAPFRLLLLFWYSRFSARCNTFISCMFSKAPRTFRLLYCFPSLPSCQDSAHRCPCRLRLAKFQFSRPLCRTAICVASPSLALLTFILLSFPRQLFPCVDTPSHIILQYLYLDCLVIVHDLSHTAFGISLCGHYRIHIMKSPPRSVSVQNTAFGW